MNLGSSWRAQGNAIQNCTHQQDSETIPKADWAQYRANGTQQRPAFPHAGVSPPHSASGDGAGSQEGQRRGGLCGFHQPFRPFVPFSSHSAHSPHSHSSTRRCLLARGRPIACRPDLFHPMPEDPSALRSSAPVRPSVPPLPPIGNPVDNPHPSGQSQLAAAARVGRLRWDKVGELDGLGALGGPTRTALSNASRLLRLLFFHFVPPPFASSLLLHPPRPRQTTSNPHPRSSAHLQATFT